MKKINYLSSDNKSRLVAKKYNKTITSLYRYLAFRDLPQIFSTHLKDKDAKALDYGCGIGISSSFLNDIGFYVDGVDVSEHMLKQAKLKFPKGNFFLLKTTGLPFDAKRYDLVFSSFVLFELSSKESILNYLMEAKRVLKDQGILVLITSSDQMYLGNWLVFDTNFPENKFLKSGDKARIYLPDEKIEFVDFYWSESDCLELFKTAGFILKEAYKPLGQQEDLLAWKDETKSSPYIVYVLKKID